MTRPATHRHSPSSTDKQKKTKRKTYRERVSFAAHFNIVNEPRTFQMTIQIGHYLKDDVIVDLFRVSDHMFVCSDSWVRGTDASPDPLVWTNHCNPIKFLQSSNSNSHDESQSTNETTNELSVLQDMFRTFRFKVCTSISESTSSNPVKTGKKNRQEKRSVSKAKLKHRKMSPPGSDEGEEEYSRPTQVRNKQRWECVECGKTFSSSGHLARHMRSHSGKKMYACPIQNCPARFDRPDGQKSHYERHLKNIDNPLYMTNAMRRSLREQNPSDGKLEPGDKIVPQVPHDLIPGEPGDISPVVLPRPLPPQLPLYSTQDFPQQAQPVIIPKQQEDAPPTMGLATWFPFLDETENMSTISNVLSNPGTTTTSSSTDTIHLGLISPPPTHLYRDPILQDAHDRQKFLKSRRKKQ
jgi:hypothetical protein